MYETQQLTPIVRRIRVARAGCAGDRLPDPWLGEWGRSQLASAPAERHESLSRAVGAAPVPLLELGYGRHGEVRISVRLDEGERLYGAYDADADALQRRGEHVHLTTELHPRRRHRMVSRCDRCASGPVGEAHPSWLNMDGSSNYGELLVPYVASSAGWGLYVSSAWHDAELDLGERRRGELRYRAPGGEADVYLFGPADVATMSAEFTRLGGTQPLPPAWALGFLQSRFGYESFDHVHRTLERFEQEQLPVHGVVFDVQWLEDHVNLRWDPSTFPDPAENLARIARRGVRTIVITEPGTRASASNHDDGAARGCFAVDADGGEYDSDQWYAKRGIAGYRTITPSSGSLLNVFREDAADWWYAQHEPLLEQGVDAWWLDLNEPEDVRADVRFPDCDWPAAREELTGDEVRGLFAIAQQRLFARRDRARTGRRPFVLSRSGSAGSQRYGTAPWTGDVASTWDDLRIQPRLVLTAGICGLPLVGCDVGGFNGDPGPELFARWMQMGSVLPVFRAHGYMRDREPWSQGRRALEAVRPSLMLRAQLLPSIVTWARQALREGEPLVRPMMFGPLDVPMSGERDGWEDDPRWADCDDQWFFGPLLAAPVLQQGADERRVELPPGTWIDVWSGVAHEGGGSVQVPVHADTLPLFLAPSTALVADADPLAGRGRAWPPDELHVWSWQESGQQARTSLYLDDGISRMHEQGAYCLQRLVVGSDGELEVERLGGSFPASRLRVVAPTPGLLQAPAPS